MAGRPQFDTSNLVGQKFNHLTITEHLGLINHIRMVKAVCDCGIEKEYRLFNIIGKVKTKSCGCYNKEVTAERNKQFATHGLTGHPLLGVWGTMKSRCYDETDSNYINYGARGVTVCKEWFDDVIVFYEWAIANGWRKGLQIDKDKLSPNRVGVIYSPETCCFLTPKENMMYRRNSRMVEYKGQKKSLAEWASVLNISYKLLDSRYQAGWTADRMFETANTKDRLIEYNGQTKCLREWAKYLGFKYATLHNRINHLGWSYQQAFTTPLVPSNQSGVHKKRAA